MSIEEYRNNYEKFKQARTGLYDDLDGQYGFQCFDLVNRYNYYVLNLGWTLNRLYNNFDTQGIYKEVPTNNMLSGDICIWQGEHICLFDHWDGTRLWFLSQDSIGGTSRRPTGVYSNVTNSSKPMRAFRPLYVDDAPKPISLPTTHIVVKDDTVAKLCRTYYGVADDSHFDLIKRVNNLDNNYLIVVGQQLTIPKYEEVKPPKEEEKPIEENNDNKPIEPPKEEVIQEDTDKPIDTVKPIKTSILDILLNFFKSIIDILLKKEGK